MSGLGLGDEAPGRACRPMDRRSVGLDLPEHVARGCANPYCLCLLSVRRAKAFTAGIDAPAIAGAAPAGKPLTVRLCPAGLTRKLRGAGPPAAWVAGRWAAGWFDISPPATDEPIASMSSGEYGGRLSV